MKYTQFATAAAISFVSGTIVTLGVQLSRYKSMNDTLIQQNVSLRAAWDKKNEEKALELSLKNILLKKLSKYEKVDYSEYTTSGENSKF